VPEALVPISLPLPSWVHKTSKHWVTGISGIGFFGIGPGTYKYKQKLQGEIPFTTVARGQFKNKP
jgi:hypothetical protein